MREYGQSVLIVQCGEPSEHDLTHVRMPLTPIDQNVTIVPGYYPSSFEIYGAETGRWITKALQTNELIGQEGGRFDAMYLEEP